MGDGYLCGGTVHYVRRIMWCWNCERRRRFVMAQPDSLWYAPTFQCCACGDEYSEEGRSPRPFERGWRTKAITRAKAAWAIGVDRATNRQWVMAELEAERRFSEEQERKRQAAAS